MRRSTALLTVLTVGSLVLPTAAHADPLPRGLASASRTAPDAPPDAPLASGPDPADVDVAVVDVALVVDAPAPAATSRQQQRRAAPDAVVGAGDRLDVDVDVDEGRLATPAVAAAGTDTVGLTWPEEMDVSGLSLEVRTRTDGTWSDWQPVEPEVGPDAGTVEAARPVRGGSEAMWIGDADAVQVSLDAVRGAGVAGLSLALVGTDPGAAADPGQQVPDDPGAAVEPGPQVSQDPGPAPSPTPSTSATPTPHPDDQPAPTPEGSESTEGAVVRPATWTAPVATGAVLTAAPAGAVAAATGAAPTVIPRSQWGAPAPVCTPDVAGTLVGAVVHHTANPNTYSTVQEAMAVMRSNAAYHINSRGWCDLGYNFVVDKWGNIYEGRAGSMYAPVVGVHAGGFNTGTVGVAMLGTYDSAPSNATQAAVGTIIGYRLGMHRVDPRGSMSYRTGEGENSRYQNTTVTLPRVFGHRDVSFTACPGNGGYAVLPMIRAVAWDVSQAAWGSPPSSLMRTADDATVYLLASGTRHVVRDVATLSAYSTLGPVTYVSKEYLAYWPVGPAVSRAAVAPTGTVYFVDAAIRLAFATCAEVTDFGLDCGTAIRLDAEQTARLHNGGRMQRTYQTTTGKTFYITDGTRREIADPASAAAAGLPSGSVRLTEGGLAYLPYGQPVVRDGLLLVERNGARSVATSPGGAVFVPSGLRGVPGLADGPQTPLDQASIIRVPTRATATSFVRGSDRRTWFLSEAGRTPVTGAAVPVSTSALPDDVLARVPQTAPAPTPFLVKTPTSGTVFVVLAGALAPLRSWSDLVRLAGTSAPEIRTVSAPVLGLLPTRAPYTPPGTLARSAASPSVFLLDGEDSRIPVSTFAVTAELGITRLTVVPDAELTRRGTGPAALRTIVTCGSQRLIGLGGQAWEILPADRSHFPSATTDLDPATCAALPRSARPASRFLRTSDGTIYWIESGTKRPISSMARFTSLGGSTATMIQISDFAAGRIPTGART